MDESRRAFYKARDSSVPVEHARLHQAGSLPRVVVDTARCSGEMYLQGAQVSAWRPRAESEVLWLSPRSTHIEGRPIRGGVPICFPWFGARPGVPSHGLARTRRWGLHRIEESEQVVTVEFTIRIDRWLCTLTASFGDSLVVTLAIMNDGLVPATFEAALHSYLRVGDVERIVVEGLESLPFDDLTVSGSPQPPSGAPLTFRGEVDRVYHGSRGVVLDDPVLRRRIIVEKFGSESTVVWNPWEDRASVMDDLGAAHWREMLCIEAGNVGSDVVTLAPQERWRMGTTIAVESTDVR